MISLLVRWGGLFIDQDIDALRRHREPNPLYCELYFDVTIRRVQNLLERLDIDGIIQLILVLI